METVMEYIYTLLEKNKVTLKMVYDCSLHDKEVISDIKKIFDLGNQQAFLLCLVALRILGVEKKEKITEYFKKDSRMFYDLDEQFFEQNKTLILTAFIYNPAFFAMAVNMHGLIEYELQKKAEPSLQTAVETAQDLLNKVYDFVFVPKPALQFGYLAASGTGPELNPVGKHVPISLNGIKGELSIEGNDPKNTGVFQFWFAFTEYHPTLPFYLNIRFVTEADKKTHEIRLDKKYDNPEEKKLVITSGVQYGIDFSEDITVKEIKGIKVD